MKIQQTPNTQLNHANQKNLKQACEQFEEYFLNMMLKNMRDTVETSSLTEKSNGRQIFEEMLDEKIAANMANGRGIGLANNIYKQLSKNIKIND